MKKEKLNNKSSRLEPLGENFRPDGSKEILAVEYANDHQTATIFRQIVKDDEESIINELDLTQAEVRRVILKGETHFLTLRNQDGSLSKIKISA